MKYFIVKLLLLSVCIITLKSCIPQKTIQQNYQYNSTDEEGLLVATITIKNGSENIEVLNLAFKNFYNEHDRSWFAYDIILKNKEVKPDTIIDGEMTFYVLAKRKPKKYKIYQYEIIKDLNKSDIIHAKPNQLIGPFDIEKGIVNYLGDFIFYPEKNKNGFYFEIKDNLNRDLKKLKKIYPKVDWNLVKNQLILSNSDLIES